MSEQRLRPDDLDVAHEIAARDRSNLFLTSQFIEDRARYHAFLAMYAVMRVIDDAVDDVADKDQLSEHQRQALHKGLDDWQARIDAAYAGQPRDLPLDRALSWALRRFPVRAEHWRRFVHAMHYDVDQPRFADFHVFLDYALGATVAPTTLYIYLLVSEPNDDGVYRVHDFDLQRCGHDLGVFAYLAHVLRDVREDSQVGERGLVYISEADLAACALTDRDLRQFCHDGCGDPRFARVVERLVERARVFEKSGVELARSVEPRLSTDRCFVLRLIVQTYQTLLDAVAQRGVTLFEDRPVLDAEAKVALVQRVARDVDFELDLHKLRPAVEAIPARRQGAS